MANPVASGLTPEMTQDFYRVRLTEVLTQHNPAGLSTIGGLLKQFPGKEHQVYVQICKKCGVEPANKPTPDDFDENNKPKSLVKENDGRVVKWLSEQGAPHNKLADKHQFKMMEWDDLLTIDTKGRLIELGVIPRNADSLLLLIRKEAGDPEPAPADFDVGETCYTKVVGGAGEKWLSARVTAINRDDDEITFDIFVYNSKAHGVPPEAVMVPRNMLKKGHEKVEVAKPNAKPEGKRPQLQQGDRVRVFGLRSHTSYNGLCGTILLYVPSERRYQVRLDTNDVIAIKQRNVAAENGEAPASANNRPSVLEMADKRRPSKETSNPREPEDPKWSFAAGQKKAQADHEEEAATFKKSDTLFNRLGSFFGGPTKEKKKKGKGAEKTDNLSGLMLKLMADNPEADPGKLGSYAAGYLLAKQKLNEEGA